jgi:mono/diheme cytochrome c family protein
MKPFLWAAVALLALQLCQGAVAQTSEAEPGLVDLGRDLATAGDCAACHGTSFAGGYPVPSPIGSIYASNITPDTKNGIGLWTLKQFSAALREGRSPDGYLYPAMPYTSYTGLSDSQILAIYSYLMLGVRPVSNNPPVTDLPFPFIRAAMPAWNVLFLKNGVPAGAISVTGAKLERGRLLVETLGHCSACHTPRGDLMQQRPERHLAGAMTGGWWAPNITPDKTGIGNWSDAQLATFLRTGHTDDAVAAGDMGTAVSLSLSKLSNDDIDAIVAYLRAVPAVTSDQPVRSVSTTAHVIQVAAVEPAGPAGWEEMLGHGTTQGDILYQSACASCHGVNGGGSADLEHPSLRRIDAVAGPQGATLVQVIANGVDRQVGNDLVLMPPFRASLDNNQIASLANYVRSNFGGIESSLDAQKVAAILDGKIDTPWPIKNARYLAISAIITISLALLVIVFVIIWARGRRHSAAAVG